MERIVEIVEVVVAAVEVVEATHAWGGGFVEMPEENVVVVVIGAVV